MEKFRHLHVPDHWEQYWSRYPQGYTILEALINWVSQVDDMVDNQNALNKTVDDFRKELDDFVEEFEPNLQEKVIDTLYEWQQSGFLDVVIDQALQTQIDDVSAQLEQTMNNVRTVSVKNFGAVGDGITDDTDAIQATFDYAENNALNVIIPSGTYIINSSGVTYSNPNSTLTFEGELKLRGGSGYPSVIIRFAADNITVYNMKLNGDSANNNKNPLIGYQFNFTCYNQKGLKLVGGYSKNAIQSHTQMSASDVYISNMSFINSGEHCFYLTDAEVGTHNPDRFVIDNCYFEEWESVALSLRDYKTVTVSNCTFKGKSGALMVQSWNEYRSPRKDNTLHKFVNCRFVEGSSNSIRAMDDINLILEGCHIENLLPYAYTDNDNTQNNMELRNCTIYHSTSYVRLTNIPKNLVNCKIKIHSLRPVNSFTAMGCEFYATPTLTQELLELHSSTTILGNSIVIENCSFFNFTNSTRSVIVSNPSIRCTFINNKFYNCDVRVIETSSDDVVIGNVDVTNSGANFRILGTGVQSFNNVLIDQTT